MNINNITEGLIVKNYREMCKLLDEKVKDGKSKRLQLEDWKRYFDWKNEKYKFIITEIYPEPKEKIDGRVNNGGNIANTKYDELMDKLIINLLVDYVYIEESFSQVMDILDLFSRKYVDLNKSGYKTFAEINKIGVGVTLTYQQKLNNIVKKCFETSLNRLAKNGVITYEKRIMMMDNKLEKSLADIEMEEKIKETEQKMYEEMDIKHYNRIIMDVNRRFKSKVGKELEIMNYWNVYCFELVDKNTDYVEEDRDELMKRLINSVVESVKGQKYKDDAGEAFQPYGYEKYQEQIDKLTRLLWKLPEEYKTETEIATAMESLFGNGGEVEEEQEQDTSYYMQDFNTPF
ncbi:hypothetical protein KQI38_03375 [Tissierella carlieri]|uniref:hypothetical protein n=1 Tax=Tissierella carlieri TaxID=689904 RepID=UPI001C11D97A|nr:hypothetical protein [Tissierella carlieri]MBU5311054.1 hypothetical protein [Tissierella carlieri]